MTENEIYHRIDVYTQCLEILVHHNLPYSNPITSDMVNEIDKEKARLTEEFDVMKLIKANKEARDEKK